MIGEAFALGFRGFMVALGFLFGCFALLVAVGMICTVIALFTDDGDGQEPGGQE